MSHNFQVTVSQGTKVSTPDLVASIPLSPSSCSLYLLEISYEQSLNWKVQRSYADFSILHKELITSIQESELGSFPRLPANEAKSLEQYLKDVLDFFLHGVWRIPRILNFLDEIPIKSKLTQLQICRMALEIESFHQKSSEWEQKFLQCETEFSSIYQNLGEIQKHLPNVDIKRNISLRTYANGMLEYSDAGNLAPQRRSSADKRPSFLSSISSESVNYQSDVDHNEKSSEDVALKDDQEYGTIIPLSRFTSATKELSPSMLVESENTSITTKEPHSLPNINIIIPISNNIPPQTNENSKRPSILSCVTSDDKSEAQSPTSALSESPQKNNECNRMAASHDPPLSPIKTSHASVGLDSPSGPMYSPSLHKAEYNEAARATAAANVTIPNSKYLTSDLFPIYAEQVDRLTAMQYLHYSIDRIVLAIQPHEEQVRYRSSAVGLIRRQIRKALNSNSFEIGLHEIRCFLPDDSIKLVAIISKVYPGAWHTDLTERFNLYMSDRTAVANGHFSMLNEDEQDDPLEDFKPLVNHVISNISFASTKVNQVNFKVACSVDSLDVEIIANSRNDLCMLAFLEDVSQLVGKDHLFKRSLLLVRAWWCYESSSYVGTIIKSIIPDMAVSIMLVAVFNVYHAKIHNPLQALFIFLSEYSQYDGLNQAITIQGIVPFKSQSSNQPHLQAVQVGHLIQTAMIEKYWLAFNIAQVNTTTDPLTQESVHTGSVSSDEPIVNINGTALNRGSSMDSLDLPDNTVLARAFVVNNEPHTNTVQYFDRFGFSIVHPFTHTNMITDRVSNRKLIRIVKAFHIGAVNLGATLKLAYDAVKTMDDSENAEEYLQTQKQMEIMNIFNNYFPALIGRFSDNWRPDALGNRIVLYPEPQMVAEHLNIQIDQLWKNIQYVNLMLESMVSESSLLTLSMEILAEKGSLPVGEIGKVLTELACIPNLSQKLKEHFGGLKKFLEKFQDKLVLSNDHPFNPHVILRNCIAPHHLELIDKGVFPAQLSIKSKKLQYANKKKKSYSIPSASIPDPNYKHAAVIHGATGCHAISHPSSYSTAGHTPYGSAMITSSNAPHATHSSSNVTNPGTSSIAGLFNNQSGSNNPVPNRWIPGNGANNLQHPSGGGQPIPTHQLPSGNPAMYQRTNAPMGSGKSAQQQSTSVVSSYSNQYVPTNPGNSRSNSYSMPYPNPSPLQPTYSTPGMPGSSSKAVSFIGTDHGSQSNLNYQTPTSYNSSINSKMSRVGVDVDHSGVGLSSQTLQFSPREAFPFPVHGTAHNPVQSYNEGFRYSNAGQSHGNQLSSGSSEPTLQSSVSWDSLGQQQHSNVDVLLSGRTSTPRYSNPSQMHPEDNKSMNDLLSSILLTDEHETTPGGLAIGSSMTSYSNDNAMKSDGSMGNIRVHDYLNSGSMLPTNNNQTRNMFGNQRVSDNSLMGMLEGLKNTSPPVPLFDPSSLSSLHTTTLPSNPSSHHYDDVFFGTSNVSADYSMTPAHYDMRSKTPEQYYNPYSSTGLMGPPLPPPPLTNPQTTSSMESNEFFSLTGRDSTGSSSGYHHQQRRPSLQPFHPNANPNMETTSADVFDHPMKDRLGVTPPQYGGSSLPILDHSSDFILENPIDLAESHVNTMDGLTGGRSRY